jgi:2'-hydroxyisoflavone reductase
MSTRREFLSLAAANVLAMGSLLVQRPAHAAKPLRFLVLGGTGNIGPYHVRAALARGHHVSVFSRGRTAADLANGVEHLIGDRNSDLKAIEDRDWDAVIDIATFGPAWVRSLGDSLGRRVSHYTFISTISVYDHPQSNSLTQETSRVLAYRGSADPYGPIASEGPDYGALKVLCEQEANKQFPGRTLIVRPGYIGGPGDTHSALPYWALRMQRGGEVLAVGDPATPVQYIDVRDMAEWIVRMAERHGTGTYNAISAQMSMADVVRAGREVVAARSEVTWVPLSWLARQEDRGVFNTLAFWEFNKGALTRISNARAAAEGLTIRPLRTTLADTLRWYRTQPAQNEVDTGPRRKPDGSGFESGHMPWPAYLAREQAVLNAWHARSKT